MKSEVDNATERLLNLKLVTEKIPFYIETLVYTVITVSNYKKQKASAE